MTLNSLCIVTASICQEQFSNMKNLDIVFLSLSLWFPITSDIHFADFLPFRAQLKHHRLRGASHINQSKFFWLCTIPTCITVNSITLFSLKKFFQHSSLFKFIYLSIHSLALGYKLLEQRKILSLLQYPVLVLQQ